MALVLVYLAAIVAANLLVARFGPAVAPLNAFLLIGLDLTTRDALHERWRGRWLAARMLALIAAGGALSWAMNADAGRIALASTVAFICAASVDGLAYALLGRQALLLRVNGSNIAGALVDSLVFPLLAFGGLDWQLVAALYAAKFAGGFVWSVVLWSVRRVVSVGVRPVGAYRASGD